MLSNVVLYVLILNRFYNVTSLVHSYIVITVFLGLVSGLLSVHSGAFYSFSIAYIFVLSFCHLTAAWNQ